MNPNEVNMFNERIRMEVPKSVTEVLAPSSVSRNLWIWARRLEKWGQILFWLIILGGIVMMIVNKELYNEVITSRYDKETVFNWGALLNDILNIALYAFLEYCVYHVLALLISAAASVVQNTKVSADMALYQASAPQTAPGQSPAEPKAAEPAADLNDVRLPEL